MFVLSAVGYLGVFVSTAPTARSVGSAVKVNIVTDPARFETWFVFSRNGLARG
jgi:hypothetical protein